ncbi:unnamed protein product, partial [Meganyctiphanes norvegica]
TVVDQLKKGSNRLVVHLFADHPGQSQPDEKKGGGKKKTAGFKTVASAYREQLSSLMNVLHSTHPHFIRCIVPNTTKTPGKIEAGLIMHQLTCNGVLEGIRICQIGLPNRMLYSDFMSRYKILGAEHFNTNPDKKKAVVAVFKKIGLDKEQFRIGATKVFFRAGVLGEVEEIRDEYLGSLMSLLQAQVKGWKSRLAYKKLKVQRSNLIIVQRNLRKYMNIRNWLWYGFWQQLKPKLNVCREQQILEDLAQAIARAENDVVIANEKNVKLSTQKEILFAKKEMLIATLESSKGGVAEYIGKENKMLAQKHEAETQLKDLQLQFENEERVTTVVAKAYKRNEQEVETIKKDIDDIEGKLQQSLQDKETKDIQIKNIGDEISHLEELTAKLNKEKKQLQEGNQKTAEDYQCVEDRCNSLNKLKGKLEQNLDELEDSLEREKKLRGEIEKAKRKVESDLKLAQEAVADLERNQRELECAVARKDSECAAMTAKIDDEALGSAKVGKQARELLARIDELEEDIKSEASSRTKAEKDKQKLARDLEEIGDRLDEAGGHTAAQIELNKKREAELSKLRKDLEENNLQQESVLISSRKKHNHAVAEMAEQIDYLNKIKSRAEKERETMRRETDDAKAAMDNLARDKIAMEKSSNQLQFTFSEISTQFDETNRNLNDFDATKKKLQVE